MVACSRCRKRSGSETKIMPGEGILITAVLCQTCLDELRDFVHRWLDGTREVQWV
jgi:hypothetical protein